MRRRQDFLKVQRQAPCVVSTQKQKPDFILVIELDLIPV